MNYEKQQNHDLLGYRTDVLSETLNDLNLATGTGASDLKATGGASAYELFGLFFRPIIIIKNVTCWKSTEDMTVLPDSFREIDMVSFPPYQPDGESARNNS